MAIGAFFDEDALYKDIGETLRTIRKARRMTQEEIAATAGLERTSIANIEHGKQKTPLHVLYKICFALRIEVAEILPSVSKTVIAAPQTTSVDTVLIGDSTHYVPASIAQALAKLVSEEEKK